MQLTDEQKRAIESPKKQVIVTASAGAGKTFTMVNRVIDLFLKNKDLSASSVIMLTFTESAAADMKSKLERAVFKRLSGASGSERTTLIRLLDTLPMLHCSTIDSFCFSFVKTHFEHSDLPPTISMLDEETAKSYREKAASKVLEDFAKSSLEDLSAAPDEYYRFLSSFGREEEKGLADAIQRVYDYAETTEDGDAFLANAERFATCPIDDIPLIKAFVAEAAFKAGNAKRALMDLAFVPPQGATRMTAYWTEMNRVLDLIAGAQTLEEVLQAAAASNLPKALYEERKLFKNECAVWDVVYERYSAWRKDFVTLGDGKTPLAPYFNKSYDEFTEDLEAARADALKMIRLTRRFKEEYRSIKRAEEVLDFSDIEHYALDLLREHPAIGEEIGCRQLMMDESQDLNRLQEALMLALKGKGDLYVVGDVKQSIYRFRLAALELFNDRVKRGLKDASSEVIRFDRNFRSSDAVVDFVNTVFSELMTEDFGGVDYTPATRGENHNGDGDVQCFFYRRTKEEEQPVNGVYSVEQGAGAADALERAGNEDKEACWVRDRILELMRDKPVLRDTEKNEEFRLTYGDITILSPRGMKSGSLEEKVVDRLREAGIPVNIGGFVKDATNADVSALMDFLRLLVSPRDDYALLSVLRSEMFSFSADDLARIARGEGDSFSEKAEKMKENDRKLGEVYEYLEKYRSLMSSLTLCELVSQLVEERLRWKILLRPDGRKSLGEIMNFIASLTSGKESDSIPEFLEFFDNYYKMDFEGEIPEQNAVNFMTIHKSKGLEAPVVFVIGLGNQIVNARENQVVVRMDSEYGVAKKTDRGNDLLFELFRIRKRKEIKEDCLRMLYVALTRARNYLFLSGGYSTRSREGSVPTKENAEYCSQLILAGMPGEYPNYIKEYDPEPIEALSEQVASVAEVAATQAEEVDREGDEALLRKAMSYVYPHLSATKTGIKYTVTGINEMTAESVVPPTRFFPEEAAAKGTAYHTVMEYVSFSMKSVEEAKELLLALAERNVITAEEAADISPKKLLDGTRKVAEIIGDKKVYREKSFLLHVSAREAGVAPIDDEVEVQGKLDLLALDEEEAVIVDYKLSAHSREEIVRTYAKQLSLYEAAVRRSFDLKKVRKYIFVLGRNELIEL